MAFAVSRGRYAHGFFKSAMEITEVMEARIFRDFLYGEAIVFKQRARFLQTGLQEKIVKRAARAFFDDTLKLTVAVVELARDVRQRGVLVMI